VRAGQTHHGRLGRKELEREVVGAIGQRIDLIRNPLHREGATEGRGKGGVADDVVSWLQVMEQKVDPPLIWKARVGHAIDGQDHYPLSAHACHTEHSEALTR